MGTAFLVGTFTVLVDERRIPLEGHGILYLDRQAESVSGHAAKHSFLVGFRFGAMLFIVVKVSSDPEVCLRNLTFDYNTLESFQLFYVFVAKYVLLLSGRYFFGLSCLLSLG
jgi:hypothetical protein